MLPMEALERNENPFLWNQKHRFVFLFFIFWLPLFPGKFLFSTRVCARGQNRPVAQQSSRACAKEDGPQRLGHT